MVSCFAEAVLCPSSAPPHSSVTAYYNITGIIIVSIYTKSVAIPFILSELTNFFQVPRLSQ
jgi:hypothetical protein